MYRVGGGRRNAGPANPGRRRIHLRKAEPGACAMGRLRSCLAGGCEADGLLMGIAALN
jgi:hypothetical protein